MFTVSLQLEVPVDTVQVNAVSDVFALKVTTRLSSTVVSVVI